MHDLKAIKELLRHNEDIARKFFKIEKSILAILNFSDLFQVLLNEIKDNFKVPYAWISMIENSEIYDFIKSMEVLDTLQDRLSIVDKDIFIRLVGASHLPLLINQNLEPYAELLPENKKFFIKSMAIAPISLDGEIIGSLNQADTSSSRFQPGIDTSLLEQLAIKVSLCLSNVTAHEKLRFLAYHDPLTGLLNRRVMETVLQREFNRERRYDGNLSVAFIDLDKFKRVNDVYGHNHGDELLIHLAEGLQRMVRDTDIVARFAGDEFVIILPETRKKSAEFLMSRIKEEFLKDPYVTDDISIPVSISFGVSSTEDPSIEDSDSLLKKADDNLYKAKRNRLEN